MKQTAFRFTDEDLAILDEAARRSGMSTRVATLRYLLRNWAERYEVDVDALTAPRKPKRKAKK